MNPANFSSISFPAFGIEVNPPRNFELGPLTIYFYGVIIACGLSMIPVDELAGRRTWNQYPLQGMKITYDFEAGGFTETRQGNEYKHNYKDIIELYADEERYYLYVKENSAYMICKRGFTEGNAEEFAKYIENKTGLKMKIKGVKEEKPKEEYWNDEDEDDEDEEN